MHRLITVALVVISLAACVIDEAPPVNPPPRSVPTTSSTTPPETAPTTTPPPPNFCPGTGAMLSEGLLTRTEEPGADGTRITGVGWRIIGECEVINITFATEDGAPATTPPNLTARLLRSEGVLRIETSATSSVIVDQHVETTLIDRLYVPVREDGTRFVDLVLTQPVLARAHIAESPARLEIELQPGGSPLGRPLMTDNIVIVQPGFNAVATPLLDITGYVSGPATTVTVNVALGSAQLHQGDVELPASPGAWTAFDIPIQIGSQRYDSVRITRPDGTVIAGIPVSP